MSWTAKIAGLAENLHVSLDQKLGYFYADVFVKDRTELSWIFSAHARALNWLVGGAVVAHAKDVFR